MKLLDKTLVRLLLLIMGILSLWISIGCQSTSAVMPSQTPAQQPIPKVTLGPGDLIDIKFYYTPELNDSQIVRPDGRMMLPLVGEIIVTGKTPDELRQELVRLYTPELRRPEIAVIIRSLYDRRIYVGGEVNTPGFILMPGPLTVLEAIMQAGGFNLQTAKVNDVVLIRQEDGKYKGVSLGFKKALKGKEVPTILLEPRDIVYVSRTKIVDVNQWIDQYINKIVPQIGVTYTRELNKGMIGIGPR